MITDTQLARTYREAMRLWDAQAADGVPREERLIGLEKTLRAAWPQTHTWHYRCERCSETGWTPHLCTTATFCGRPFRFPRAHGDDYTGRGHCVSGHPYVVPCWCDTGEAKRRALMHIPSEADIADAGRRKSTRLTRVGG